MNLALVPNTDAEEEEVLTITPTKCSRMGLNNSTYSIPNLPVVCIMGGPNSDDYDSNYALHHTIGLPDFSQELWCFQMVTCYQAFIHNLDDAHERIGTSIATMLRVRGMRVADTRTRAGLGRRARLASAAAVLNACDPDEAAIEAGLQSALPEPPSEQDAVIVLNMAIATRPEIVVLARRWFLGNAEVQKKVILYNVELKLLRKKQHWCETEAPWAKMLRHGMQPDNTIFSTINSCACAYGLLSKVVKWFDKMSGFGCSPDWLTYSAVIDTYDHTGNFEAALRRARAEKWQLDPVLCCTVNEVHSTSGNFNRALNLFKEMKATGVNPNLVMCNTRLYVMGHALQPWVVKSIHREMIDKQVQHNKVTYCCLLHAYTRAHYDEDAMAVYRLMKDEAMDVMLYNMLLSRYVDIGYVDEAEEIFRDMKASMDDRSKPDKWSYSSMLRQYSSTANVLGVEGILNEMVEELGKVISCVETDNHQLGSIVKPLVHDLADLAGLAHSGGFKQPWPPPMEFECLDCAWSPATWRSWSAAWGQAAF
jgi:pentatricopeptide repeat protein|uniref:Pentatricopeptide repeat-containing protein n=1 Tax=Zea mays TaxID=4577 RepID=A0A804REL2_MAIZE